MSKLKMSSLVSPLKSWAKQFYAPFPLCKGSSKSISNFWKYPANRHKNGVENKTHIHIIKYHIFPSDSKTAETIYLLKFMNCLTRMCYGTAAPKSR